MKTVNDKKAYFPFGGFKRLGTSVVIASFFAVAIAGCRKDELNEIDADMANNPAALTEASETGTPSTAAMRAAFGVVNLVGDRDGYGATRIDRNLMNAWGMDFGTDGSVWIAANGHGSAAVYNQDGSEMRPFVGIGDAAAGAGPTSILSNRTREFKVPLTGRESQFLFATQDGKVIARSFGDNITVIDRTSERATYTGIDVGSIRGAVYLYVADFANGKVEAYDGSFRLKTTFRFQDPTMATGYKPYNVKVIGNRVWVAYAKQMDGAVAATGRGMGYINIFDADGQFVRRFASGGVLDAPYGIEFSNNHIFVANHGNGRINVYDLHGRLQGPIHMNGRPLEISGLWSIGHAVGTEQTYMYFTSSPVADDRTPRGLFGYIKRAQ